MIDTHAEAESSNPLFASKPLFELLHHGVCPNVGGSDRLSKPLNVVTGTSAPRYVAQIEIVRDPEVGKRYQSMLIDSVPKPQLGCDSVLELVEHWQAIAPFRSGG
jgi:hypothetical protein